MYNFISRGFLGEGEGGHKQRDFTSPLTLNHSNDVFHLLINFHLESSVKSHVRKQIHKVQRSFFRVLYSWVKPVHI